jgi:hypothetical protein
MFKNPHRLPHQRYLLLIGAPRSGTTLLATMIGRHTDVGMVNEDISGKGLIKILGKPLTGNKLCVPNQIQLHRRGGLVLTLLRKLGITSESPRSRHCILDYLELPNLKLVAIVRDGNDSIASMVARGETRFKKAARRWGEAIEAIFELRARFSERVLVVTFEELVLRPANTLEKLCAFLEIEFQEQMMDGYKYNRYYPRNALNKEKAYRHTKEEIDFRLDRLLPTPYDKYQRLLADCQHARGNT